MATSALNIREQLAGLSPAKRALIELKLLKKKADAGEPQPLISRRPEGVPVPLSFYQQGLWVLTQFMPETSLYHVPKAVKLTGTLDVAALKKTLDQLVQRHEALRTTFATTEGVPMQVVSEQVELALPVVDLSELAAAERELETRRLLRDETRRPFDLAHGPLV
ncbi:MAG: condensation domain-containing protein, partial [bacterium]